MLPRHVRSECKFALAAVHLGPRKDLNHEVCALDVITILYLGQNNLIVRIPDLHMHTDLGTGGGEPVGPRVVQLHLVVT